MELGARIAAWRKVRGLSPQDLAKKVGVSPAAVYQWEGCGESKTTPRQKHLDAIVVALGLTMEQFYGRLPKGAKAS